MEKSLQNKTNTELLPRICENSPQVLQRNPDMSKPNGTEVDPYFQEAKTRRSRKIKELLTHVSNLFKMTDEMKPE